MRLPALLPLLLVTAPGGAQDAMNPGPASWNGHVVSVGDSAERLLEILGAPMRRMEIEDRADGGIDERWTYVDPQDLNRTLTLRLRGGRLVEVRAASLPE